MVNVARPALSPPPSLPVQAKKCENTFAIVLTGNFASESQQLAATFQAGKTVLVRPRLGDDGRTTISSLFGEYPKLLHLR